MTKSRKRPELKWPITVERVIAASVQDVWVGISSPGNLEKCHPFCARNPVQVWPGADSRDEIHYLNGLVYERRFYQWLDGAGYDLEIVSAGKVIAVVSWRVTPIDGQRCKLGITIYPRVPRKYPKIVGWLIHSFRLRPMLRKYLKSVVKGFEWYVTGGEPVARNQFGSHPWFSTPGPSRK